MVSTVIKNWDNKNWLSSKDYIKSFNKFLIKQVKLNSKSRILDIGCGRGKILGNLSSKLRLKIASWKDELNNIIDSLKGTTQLFLDDNNEFDILILKLEELK